MLFVSASFVKGRLQQIMAFEVEHIPCIGLPTKQHLLEGSIPVGARGADQGVVQVGGQEGHDVTKEENGKMHLAAGWFGHLHFLSMTLIS